MKRLIINIILFIGALIFGYSSCNSVTLPQKLKGESDICYYYKWTIYGLQKNKDQSNIVRIQDDCRETAKALDCKNLQVGCKKE